jgi:hypothetical protein
MSNLLQDGYNIIDGIGYSNKKRFTKVGVLSISSYIYIY